MSEEEKEAIEELKQIRNSLYVEEYHYEWQLAIDIILNYINKLQEEVQYEKNEKMNLAGMLDEKDEEIKSLETDLEIGNNMCAKLQKELEQEKEKNIELAEELQIAKGGIKIANLDMVDNNFVSKDKIKEALDYIEENSFEDTTGVVLNLQDESYWKLWKILKGE